MRIHGSIPLKTDRYFYLVMQNSALLKPAIFQQASFTNFQGVQIPVLSTLCAVFLQEVASSQLAGLAAFEGSLCLTVWSEKVNVV